MKKIDKFLWMLLFAYFILSFVGILTACYVEGCLECKEYKKDEPITTIERPSSEFSHSKCK